MAEMRDDAVIEETESVHKSQVIVDDQDQLRQVRKTLVYWRANVKFMCFLSSGRRKERKTENDPPIRLLDDLFRKTKATPCIYWLPLTSEQVKLFDLQ